MRPSLRACAGAIALAFISGCVSLARQGPGPALIEHLTVQNAHTQGGTGKSYRLSPGLDAASVQPQYVDRAAAGPVAMPAALRGQTFIRTADGDRAAAAGSAQFLSFEVAQSSTVYVAHDVHINPKPRWLLANFLDTGMQLRIGTVTFELFSNIYPSHSLVTLGSNIATGGNGAGDMYSAIVVPTAVAAETPGAPSATHIICATAAVVGLQWNPPTDAPAVAGYRVSRDGTVIATTFNTYFSDTSVTASAAYTYVVSVFDGAGNSAASTALQAFTAPPTSGGDAPYCASAVVRRMTWDWAGGYTQANGSDLWPATWGDDGNVYTFFGDGGGFGGDNARGRASFGIAMIAGAPPPTAATAHNIYGGYQAEHPSTLNGKASAVIAIGSDFYAIAGIYRPTDLRDDYPHLPSGSPNHLEIAYSIGNAYSWQDGSWTFCGMQPSGQHLLSGSFCPQGFVSYGAGNAGARDQYVYVFGADAASNWGSGQNDAPANTYLARVPHDKIATQSAYEYFAGWDSRGAPIWRTDSQAMQPVFSDANAAQPGCTQVCSMASPLAEAVYVPALKRYIGVAQGGYAAQTSFYEAPDPWGPWAVISYNNIDAASGTGGWGNLGAAAGESLGVHFVNAWTSTTGQTLWATYSSSGTAPAGALFPPAGTAMDSFNLVRVDLQLASQE
jgi:hypothetical protein